MYAGVIMESGPVEAVLQASQKSLPRWRCSKPDRDRARRRRRSVEDHPRSPAGNAGWFAKACPFRWPL